jgi:hypothetical protein
MTISLRSGNDVTKSLRRWNLEDTTPSGPAMPLKTAQKKMMYSIAPVNEAVWFNSVNEISEP